MNISLTSFSFKVIYSYENTLDKIVAQPPTTLCIQFLTRENNDKNNTFPSGKKIFFYNSIGPAETLAHLGISEIRLIVTLERPKKSFG